MVVKSQSPPIDIPDLDLWEFLLAKPRGFSADKVLFLDPKTNRHYTFDSLQQTSLAFGNALRKEWNWQKGDTIAWYSPNSIDTPPTIMGTLSVGGIVTLANASYSASELGFQLKDSGAKAIITQTSCLKNVFEAAKIAGIPRNRILLIGDARHSEIVHLSDFIASSEKEKPSKREQQDPRSLAFLVYSSGTTGLPKGVMLTHRNLVANTLQVMMGGTGVGPADTVVGLLPFAHIAGMALQITFAISVGTKIIVLPNFDLETFCQIVQKHKVTFAHLVPPIVLLLSKSPIVDKYDLSSIRMCSSAAAPLTRDLVEKLWARLRIPCRQAYGISETSPGISVQSIGEWQKTIGSCGKIHANQQMLIVSPSGEEVPTGSEGEILIKGPNVFVGYHKNPTATANSMTADGFFRTGDIGYLDSEGNLYITDRLKELIKYNGFQVAPAELEGYLVSHSKVADACVVGVQDEEKATELPRAYLVKADNAKNIGDSALEKEIKDWINGKVASHKRLRGGIRFVDVIPKSAAGKILRRVLRDAAKMEHEGRRNNSKL